MNVKYENIVLSDPQLGIACCESDKAEDLLTYPHVHDEVEIVYILLGRLLVNVDDEEQYLCKGDIVILNRLAPHEFRESTGSEPLRYLMLQFKPNRIFDNKKIDIRFLEPFYHTNSFSYYYGNRSSDSLDGIVDTLLCILKHVNEKEFGYQIMVQAQLLQLLFMFHHYQIFACSTHEMDRRAKYVQRLSNLQKYIDIHYAEDISVSFACELVQLDYHYFSRLFKQETGKTFIEYVNMVRMLHAQELLQSTNYPIQYIAESIGIPNITYFNRIFKKYNGVPPTEYRRGHTRERLTQ